ncbi:MAG TPA: amidohydrolase family protein [Candidatus Sulfotelmatobacter sp.]|nr:amidohydrolase family protein [Candidatus Sulfotelmatobacter sp.]
MPTVLVKDADWAVVWENAAPESGPNLYGGRHAFLKGCDLAFADDRLVFVGSNYAGAADTVIDGRDKMILPGFVNIHSHPNSEPMLKGLSEERKSRQLNMSSLYEYIFLLGRPAHDLAADPDTAHFGTADFAAYSASCQVAIAEMLRSGVTCFVDYSANRPNWLDEVARTGIRTVVAPSFRSGEWYTENGHEVLYRWNEPRGRQGLDTAVALVMRAQQHPSGLLSGMMAPAQVDTCTADLMVDASAVARDLGVPCQTHCAQSVVEMREMFRRHGTTSVGWLEALGVLGPHMILGHAMFLDHHSWIRGPDHRDLDRIADTGTSVAHCPNQFARGGMVLEHFGKYAKRGVNLGLGTDTFPHNFVDEMRWALVVAKIASADIGSTSLAEIFTAATVGGAKALGRDDIGRLAPGCKADFSLVDLAHPAMQPARDPLKSLVFTALERPITDVYVAGKPVVRDGTVLTIDLEANLAELTAGQARNMRGIPERDWAKRSPDEAFPMSLGWAGSNR